MAKRTCGVSDGLKYARTHTLARVLCVIYYTCIKIYVRSGVHLGNDSFSRIASSVSIRSDDVACGPSSHGNNAAPRSRFPGLRQSVRPSVARRSPGAREHSSSLAARTEISFSPRRPQSVGRFRPGETTIRHPAGPTTVIRPEILYTITIITIIIIIIVIHARVQCIIRRFYCHADFYCFPLFPVSPHPQSVIGSVIPSALGSGTRVRTCAKESSPPTTSDITSY